MLDEIMREQQRKMKEIKSFVNECREYIEIKMKGEIVEDQILWVLTYMNRVVVDSWKEIIKDNLKEGLKKYVTLEEFFKEIRKEFGKKGKGKKTEEDREKGKDGFWNMVKGKEEEIVKKKPKVEVTTPRIPVVERGSGFWKR